MKSTSSLSTKPSPNQLTEATALVRLAAEIRARKGGMYMFGTHLRAGAGPEIEALALLGKHLGLFTDAGHWSDYFDYRIQNVLHYEEGQKFAGDCVKVAVRAASIGFPNLNAPHPDVLFGPFPEIAATIARIFYASVYKYQSTLHKEYLLAQLRKELEEVLRRDKNPEYDLATAKQVADSLWKQYEDFDGDPKAKDTLRMEWAAAVAYMHEIAFAQSLHRGTQPC